MSCKYCKPLMTIRKTTLFERIPASRKRFICDGTLSIRAIGAEFVLHYENDTDVFYSPVEIRESWPINYCPMCGEKLPSASEVDV